MMAKYSDEIKSSRHFSRGWYREQTISCMPSSTLVDPGEYREQSTLKQACHVLTTSRIRSEPAWHSVTSKEKEARAAYVPKARSPGEVSLRRDADFSTCGAVS